MDEKDQNCAPCALTEEARCTIERLYPEQRGSALATGEDCVAREDMPQLTRESREVKSPLSGYIQMIDDDTIMDQATASDLVLIVEARPGSFVREGEVIVSVWPLAHGDEETWTKLQNAFVIGQERTPFQDLDFAMHRIVELPKERYHRPSMIPPLRFTAWTESSNC